MLCCVKCNNQGMDRFQALQAFVRVVETGSFARAADKLGVSTSAVSRQVAELESHLNVRLLQRTTRRLSLTDTGQQFYERGVQLLGDLDEAESSVRAAAVLPQGTLRLTCAATFGVRHMAPAIAAFVAQYPQVQVEIDLSDRAVDLVEEGHDVAIRIAREPSLHLVARELAPVRRVICATPAYFRHHGVPATPHELQAHNCLHRTPFGAQAEWRLHGPQGEAAVRIKGSLRIDDDDTLAQAALSGLGIALLPTFIIGGDLQAGRLQAVLGDYVPLERRVYAVHLPNRHLPAKVRAFVELLRERFGPVPYWDRGVPGVSAGETQ